MSAAAQFTRVIVPAICKPTEKRSNSEDGSEIIESIPAKYEGHVVVRSPSYLEKQDMMEVDSFKGSIVEVRKRLLEKGITDEETLATEIARAEYAKIVRNVIKNMAPFLVEISIKRIEDGFVFTSYDELNFDSDGGSVLRELASELLSKFQVGKSKPTS